MRSAALISVLMGLAACASGPKPSPSNVAGPALHAVQDKHLRELMAEMNSLIISEKEMTDLQRDVRLHKYDLRMAETAAAMGKTVDAIVAALPSLKLSGTEQTTFLALADKLRRESAALRDLAGKTQSDAIPAQLERMDVTCKACHRLFRTSGG